MAAEKEKSSATVQPAVLAVAASQNSTNGFGHSAANDQAAGMDQVREILFGETKRSTDKALKALENRIEELTATVTSRFSEVMALIAEVQSNSEKSQATTIDEIGAAISQLSSTIRNVSVVRKTK